MGFSSSNCSSAQAAKKPPPHCSWSRARFTKPGLGWQCLVKAKGGDRSAQESPGLWIAQGGGSLPRVTVTVAERVQVQVVVITVRGEGVDDMPSALLVIPAAPVSVLEFA